MHFYKTNTKGAKSITNFLVKLKLDKFVFNIIMTFNLGVIDFRDGQQSVLLEMKKKLNFFFKWNMAEQK